MTGSYFHKKIILILALAAFLVGGFFPIRTVEAAHDNADVGQSLSAGIQQDASSTSSRSSGGSDAISCVKGDFPYVSPTGCIAVITFTMLQVASWVLMISAVLFNATINYTLNMAAFIQSIPIVAVGWTVFRDLMNLLFIFIILYIGISTIIGNEGYGIKKLLGKVIVGAMMINFSLFFTQVMIDASNIFALQFYNKIIVSAQGANTAAGQADSNMNYDSGISAAFVNAMGLQQIFLLGNGEAGGQVTTNTGNSNLQQTKLGLNAGNLILVSIGGTVLVLITAFVFFAGTFMMLARTVMLIFLMILSPIAFMGNILPAIGKYTGDWWSKLTNNLLFAPAYMMLLYLVINMITSESFKAAHGGMGTFADMFAGGKNWIPTVITFIVLIMLMLGCLMIASKLGVTGGKWAEKTGFGLGKTLGMSLSGVNAARNLSVGVGRGTAGRIGDKVSGSKFLARMSTKPGFGRGAAALMQKGDKLKDVKIGGQSFNDQVKDKQKDYTKRGNLIEKALGDYKDDPNLTKAENAAEKKLLAGPAAQAEADYLAKNRFGYANNSAIKKAAKAAKGTNNKEALEGLLSGKFSPEEHKKATEALEGITDQHGVKIRDGVNDEIQALHARIKTAQPHEAALLGLQLNSLIQQKQDLNTIIKGHLDTVGKLSNLESK